MSTYSHYFALEKQLKAAGYPVDRFEMIRQWSNGRLASLSDMSSEEYRQFLAWMRTTYGRHIEARPVNDYQQRSKSIRTAVHYLCLCGMVTPGNKPDYERINAYVRNIGSNNPRKVDLRQLNASELNKVVSQIKAMYKKEVAP